MNTPSALRLLVGACALGLVAAACGSAPEASTGPSVTYDVGTASKETPVDPAVLEAARGESPLLIYGNANDYQMTPLIDGFEAKNPGLSVQYLSLGGPETFQRYLSEKATGGKTADLIIESNGPLWMDFSNRGEVEDYRDANLENLPSFVDLRPGITAMSMDPLVAVFNKAILPESEQPTSLAGLADMSERLSGKIGTYEIENALGYEGAYAYLNKTGEDGWQTLEKLGPHTKAEASAGAMTTKLTQGAYAVTFNNSGASRTTAVEKNSTILNFRYLTDDTPLVPRAMGITKGASSPNTAKAFYNFALSVDGQTAACAGGFTPFRDGVDCKYGLSAIKATVGEDNLIFGTYDDSLATSHDEIVERWNGLFDR
ncbi:ABC transporter substrate-binding protein [Rhodococcus opacus]|uniref:ABC transporter substrate-binding protein n=1 Tax=Rhodococcus opacus TaxID=37919 RepID=UPI0010570791|nr:extracellular solute-binding protein [Rhodococcus opacus]